MTNREYKLFFEDMLEAINKIEEYLANRSFEEFIKDEMLVDAVIRRLGIIGKAAAKILTI